MANENMFLMYALFLGVFITFVYDLIRIARRVIPHKRFWISVEDLAFWIFCGIEVFLLMYNESNGTLRWFAVLGALCGMFLYKKIISGAFVKYTTLVLQKILGFIGKILSFIFKPVRLAGKAVKKTAGKVLNKRKAAGAFLKNKLTYAGKMLKMVIKKR